MISNITETLTELGIMLPILILVWLCFALGMPLLMLWALQLIGLPVVINLASWFGMVILMVGLGRIRIHIKGDK